MDTLRVLVADDEIGMREGVARALGGCRLAIPEAETEVVCEIEAVATGEEALERVRSAAPDLLLLDHKLPGLSGLDVLDRLAGVNVDLLTVMITAYASIETAVIATRRGAYDFLAKPFTPAELKGVVRKAAARLLLARRARQLADEKRQVRFEFVRVLGHELQAPLAAVTSQLDLLRTRALGDDVAAYDEVLGRARGRLDGMRGMIRDLLDLTRIESGRKPRRVEPLDLRRLADAATETFTAAAAERGIVLAVRGADVAPLHGDRGELEMLLNNLVSNAVKYNRPGGRVDVEVDGAASVPTLRVTDTGVGMTPEQLERLFGEFVRFRGPETAHVEGTGLGLSIVRKLVQLQGGRIQVTSEPGRGTTVHVELAPGEAASAGAP